MTGGRWDQFLRSENAPFVVTVLLGVFSWIVSHTEARYSSVAILELKSYVPTMSVANSRLQTRLENISVASTVDCVDLIFVPKQGESIDSYTITYLTNLLTAHTVRREDSNVVLQLRSMQPSAALSFTTSGQDVSAARMFTAHCVNEEDGSVQEGSLPIIKPLSTETFIIKNSLALLWIALLLSALALISGLFRSRKRSENPADPDLK